MEMKNAEPASPPVPAAPDERHFHRVQDSGLRGHVPAEHVVVSKRKEVMPSGGCAETKAVLQGNSVVEGALRELVHVAGKAELQMGEEWRIAHSEFMDVYEAALAALKSSQEEGKL